MTGLRKATLSSCQSNALKQRITSILRDTQDAEDAIQDAYVRVLEIDGACDAIQNPGAYLNRAARNVALDKLRRKRRTDRIFVAMESSEDVREQIMARPCLNQRADDRLHQQQTISAVMDAVAMLPPKCGQAYLMSCIDEYTYSEIASEIGVSVSMIEKYVAHARRHVRASVPADFN
ncbi:RNA polymerase sigma factor [Rhizorhabdus dicambivorans]|nr:RNA polymerase sigma factor [Rhizorhabdus dicambivorans]